MASLTGTPVTIDWGDTQNPSPQNISVPGDAKAVVAAVCRFSGSHGATVSSFTLNGEAPSYIAQLAEDHQSPTFLELVNICIAVWLDPPTGTQALDIAFTADEGSGAGCIVDFATADGGLDVRDIGVDHSTSADAISFALDSESGDLAWKFDSRWTGGGGSFPSLGSGWANRHTHTAIRDYASRASYRSAPGSSTTFDAEDESWSGLAGVVLYDIAPATVEQTGFRFYNDDGDEDGSTAAAAQDANLTTATAVNKIIRFLLQADGDPASKTFTLRAQKNGAGGYLPVAVGASPTGTINNQPVAAGADDAQQSGSTMTVTGTTIGASLDATTEYVGIRFGSVNIPKGATITTAYMRVVPSGTGEDEPLVTIAGLDEDNAAAFTTTANDITSRAITTATASWSSTDLGASGSSYHNTPSLVSIVQEIIDRAGWASGNAIGFRIQGGSTTTRDLTIESYENTGNNPPQLYVEYTYSPDIFISPSSNITNGEATTQRLSGGTGTFDAGVLNDTANGITLDIGEDRNSEIGWSIQQRSGLSEGDYFDLKVYDGETALTGTAARITVGSGGQEGDLTVAGSFGATFVGRATTRAALVAALGAGATQSGRADTQASLSAAVGAGASVVRRVGARASLVAGVGAGSADAAAAAAQAAVSVPAALGLVAAALSQAAAAIQAGLAAGESWAGHAQSAADMAAAGEFGAAFDAETTSAQTGAVQAGTAAGASFTAAAQAVASVTHGASLTTVIAGIAQAQGALSAGSSLTLAAAALVSAQAAVAAGVALGEMWAGHADASLALAAAGEFGATFDAATQSAQVGALSAGTAAAAQFASAVQSLGALTATASFGAAILAIVDSQADLTAAARFGATFQAFGGDAEILPPAHATLVVEPRSRVATVAPRSRVLRIVPRVRTIRLH